MSSNNDFNRFVLPDHLTNDYAIPYVSGNSAIAVGVGDLCYWKTQDSTYGDVAWPADQLTSTTSEALDQFQFGSLFVGVSQEQILSTETNKNKKFTVRTDGVFEFKCPSQTFKKGALVGIYSNGTALDPQQVDALQYGGVAIGCVVKDYPVATTRVRVRLVSRYSGLVPGGGLEPAGTLTMFGGSAYGALFGAFGEEGNLYRNVGNPIAGNGADATDDVLDGFVLPAGAFDQAKRGLTLTFSGKFGATANNKVIKIWLNPTFNAGPSPPAPVITNGVITGGNVTGAGSGVLVYTSGTQTGNNVGWSILVNLFKYGANGSNTQYAQVQPIFGATHGGTSAPSFLTIPENAAINVVVTGSSGSSAANDVVLNFSEVNAMN
jgi:hypothetical protein